MFRDMRRKGQLLSENETIKILNTCTSGVLALIGDDDYPYAVPLSYAYKDGSLFFHFAMTGHKIDAIKKNKKVSFCVIEKDEVIQETFTTHFCSVIVFLCIKILAEDSEKKYALECLVEKYSPQFKNEGEKEIEREWSRVCAAELKIEHMTGKAAIEIVKKEKISPTQIRS
jgi:hypothetical protein